MSTEMYTTSWFDDTFVPLVKAARKANVNPKCVDRFMQFLRDSKDHRLNWAASTVRSFSTFAGEFYEEFIDAADDQIE